MPKRLPGMISAVLIVVTVLTGAAGPPVLQAGEIRIGTWKTAQTIQPFFYNRFLPNTDRVVVCPFTNPADQKMALLAGSLDMCGTTIAHAVYSASRGEPVVVVAALCNRCSALVVGSDTGIGGIRDLKGRRIGYVPGTMHEILLREVLNREGISPDRDVQLRRIDFFDMGTALSRGHIDAFLSGEPYPSLAGFLGYGTILAYPYYTNSIGTINAAMLVTRKTIEKSPEGVLKLVLAHARSTRYLNSHPGEWLRRASDFGVSLDVLKRCRINMEPAWEINEAFVRRAKALGARMLELGLISALPDYKNLFDLTFSIKVNAYLDLHES